MQGWSEKRCHGIDRRGGREARLARGREHDAFLGHEMRGPAGTGRGGVSMAGGREGQGARKGNWVRGHRLLSPPWFVQTLLRSISAFCLNEKGWWRTSVLCTHIHEYLYISYLFHFVYFFVISTSSYCMLDVIIGRHTWNCQIHTHIHTGYTHTGTHTKKVGGKKKRRGVRKERKKGKKRT